MTPQKKNLLATQRRKQGDQEGTGGPGRPGQRHAQEEQAGRYRSSSVIPVFQPNFQYFHSLQRTHHIVLGLQASTHHDVLNVDLLLLLHQLITKSLPQLLISNIFKNQPQTTALGLTDYSKIRPRVLVTQKHLTASTHKKSVEPCLQHHIFANRFPIYKPTTTPTSCI